MAQKGQIFSEENNTMKKILLSVSAFALVAVTAIAVAPNTAEAIPAFARQTGAACFSCHFQEVPALRAFGRSFKMNSFTDVGDQALIEDESLSIPAVLNASFVVRGDMTHTSGGGGAATTVYNIPVDQNLLIAGRAGTNTGVFLEFGGGAGDTNTGGLNNMQVMNSFDAGGFKIGLSYADTSFGGDAILAVNSVYGQHSGAVGGLGDVSAVQNSGFTNSMTSLGAWIGNDLGFIQFALIAPGGAAGWTGAGANFAGVNATNGTVDVGTKFAKLFKIVATQEIGGFDTLLGLGVVTGKVGKSNGAATTPADMNLQFLFGQMQGDMGDMSVGVYADWAHAKGKPNGNILGAQDTGNTIANAASIFNNYNALNINEKFDAYSIRATVEPISRLTVGLGYGYRKTTDSVTPANGNKHQVFKIGAGYSIYQNMILSLSYSNDKTTTPGSASTNTKTTVLDYVIYL